MSILIDSLYSMLGLTADEQAVVNSALPAIKDLLDAVDANLSVINQVEQLQIKNQPLIKQLVADWAIIGPNFSAATVDGSVDLFGTLNAFTDIKSKIAANPQFVASATAIYNQLLPVINKAIADWPKIALAVQVIMNGSKASNMPIETALVRIANGG